MDTPKSKNKEYVRAYREKQKSLGRRARLLYLTDSEFEYVKQLMVGLRNPSTSNENNN